MKNEKLYGLIAAIILLLAVAFFSLNSLMKTERVGRELYSEFPSISLEESLDGYISSVYHGDQTIFRNDPHHAYITINNQTKKRLITSFELNTDMFLDDVIDVGDRIFKESGSDTINLLKLKGGDTINFQFEMRDDLRYPLKKRN